MTGIRPMFYTDELFVGQTAQQSKTITETDIILFSAVSMDTNAIHLDEDYAKTWMTNPDAVEVMLTKQNIDGSTGYYAIGFARADSGIKSMDDAKYRDWETDRKSVV